MKVLVVDDEPLARARLKSLLIKRPEIETVIEAENGFQALEQQQSEQADVVLLDIRMPGMDGLEAASHLAGLDRPPVVIFTTAYDEHALEAFNLQAIGYLVKPVNKERLWAAMDTAGRLTTGQLAQVRSEQRQYLSARTGDRLEMVAIKDVYYFRADQKYVVARHLRGELLLEESLKHLESELSSSFIRIHRNALVALDKVSGIQKTTDGHQIQFRDIEEQLEISRRLLSDVRKVIKDHSLS